MSSLNFSSFFIPIFLTRCLRLPSQDCREILAAGVWLCPSVELEITVPSIELLCGILRHARVHIGDLIPAEYGVLWLLNE